jgi:PAT family beta-lactamase induction signal transducer AmpG
MTQFGLLKGTFGMAAVIAGNILGGVLLARFGFKKCIWPFALALTLPNFVYLYMAYAFPSSGVIGILLALEQFGYGLGFMAFTVFVMRISSGGFKTSHYAISTGIMALGMMAPGMLSGAAQTAAGYKMFYWFVIAASVPGLFTIPFILKTPVIENEPPNYVE